MLQSQAVVGVSVCPVSRFPYWREPWQPLYPPVRWPEPVWPVPDWWREPVLPPYELPWWPWMVALSEDERPRRQSTTENTWQLSHEPVTTQTVVQ
jgi:hypothetical protein